MEQNLLNISPIDGRYHKKTVVYSQFFSEFALSRYRVYIELEFIKHLASSKIIKGINATEKKIIKRIIDDFSEKDLVAIKRIEDKIHHDVKAVEYWLREVFGTTELKRLSPFIHIGLTSDDVNNLVYGLILRDFQKKVINPRLEDLIKIIKKMVIQYEDISFLARTHSQPAVTTTFGKEMGNFYYRLKKQQKKIMNFQIEGKLNGAVGLYNGLNFIYPQFDWLTFSRRFITSLGLSPNLVTTQILPYDNWLEFFQIMFLINGILIGLCQDFWSYILLAEVKLKKEGDQVGSSTMPQKLNPIDFENAEGNLQLANNFFIFFINKLTSSRLQRDLTDSTVRRSFGSAFTHSLLGWGSLMKGLGKCSLDREKIQNNLNSHWEVLAEAVQLFLRVKGDDKAYEKLRILTQKKNLLKEDYENILKQLGLDKEKKLTQLTPDNYLGLSKKIISYLLKI